MSHAFAHLRHLHLRLFSWNSLLLIIFCKHIHFFFISANFSFCTVLSIFKLKVYFDLTQFQSIPAIFELILVVLLFCSRWSGWLTVNTIKTSLWRSIKRIRNSLVGFHINSLHRAVDCIRCTIAIKLVHLRITHLCSRLFSCLVLVVRTLKLLTNLKWLLIGNTALLLLFVVIHSFLSPIL